MRWTIFLQPGLLGVAGHGTLLESLQSDDFVPYLGYEGVLATTGNVGPLTTNRFTQSFSYALQGVDPRCVDGADPNVADSCGLHVHFGVSCAKKSGKRSRGGAPFCLSSRGRRESRAWLASAGTTAKPRPRTRGT